MCRSTSLWLYRKAKASSKQRGRPVFNSGDASRDSAWAGSVTRSRRCEQFGNPHRRDAEIAEADAEKSRSFHSTRVFQHSRIAAEVSSDPEPERAVESDTTAAH